MTFLIRSDRQLHNGKENLEFIDFQKTGIFLPCDDRNNKINGSKNNADGRTDR
jgi:hypothetical protein